MPQWMTIEVEIAPHVLIPSALSDALSCSARQSLHHHHVIVSGKRAIRHSSTLGWFSIYPELQTRKKVEKKKNVHERCDKDC